MACVVGASITHPLSPLAPHSKHAERAETCVDYDDDLKGSFGDRLCFLECVRVLGLVC